MKEYIYPKDLKISATVFLWRLRDALLLLVFAIAAVIFFALTKMILPLVAAAVFGVLTIDIGGGIRIYDYLKLCTRFFGGQRIYFWRK